MESSLRGHHYQQQQQHQNGYPPQTNHHHHPTRSALSSSLSAGNHHHRGGQQQYHNHNQINNNHDYASSVGSHYSRGSHGSQSHQSSQVDEAARRLGHRLSMSAHGDKPVTRPQKLSRIGMTPKSGFLNYADRPPHVSPPEESAPTMVDTDGSNSEAVSDCVVMLDDVGERSYQTADAAKNAVSYLFLTTASLRCILVPFHHVSRCFVRAPDPRRLGESNHQSSQDKIQ